MHNANERASFIQVSTVPAVNVFSGGSHACSSRQTATAAMTTITILFFLLLLAMVLVMVLVTLLSGGRGTGAERGLAPSR